MNLPQLFGYGLLALIALYIAYLITMEVFALIWLLIKLFVGLTLLVVIIRFLNKKGFFAYFTNKSDF